MGRQRLLDGSRIDIVSSSNDQLLLAPGKPEITVRVASAEIPGIEPALAVDVDKGADAVAGVEIALEHIGPADRDDADLVDVGHPLKAPVAVKHDRFHPLIGDGQADRARAPLARGRIDRGNAAAFREAVALENLHSGLCFESADEGRGHRRGATDREPETGDVAVAYGRLHQGCVKGRNAREHRHAVARYDLPKPGDDILSPIAVGRGDDDTVAAHPRLKSGDELTVDVEQGQAAEDGSWRAVGLRRL